MKKIKYLLTLLIMLLAFSFAYSDTYHSGVISSTTDWRPHDNTHIVTGDLWITGCTLIIRSGAIVELHANIHVDGTGTLIIEKNVDIEISGIIDLLSGYETYYFDIQGTLDAQGTSTSGEEIVFHEDDYYDGYGWEGIRFSDSATNCVMKYCIIKEAKKPNSSGNSIDKRYAGGAIYIEGNLNVDIENCEFDDNESSWGGAICCKNGGSSISIKSNEFHDNTASSGGAVYLNNTDDVRISLNKFYTNSSDNYGGAVFLDNYSDNVEFYNNLLNNNTASYGGGLAIDDSDPEIYNNTIADNEATTNGSGCYYDENTCNPDFRNTIIYFNTTDQVFPDPDNNTGDYEYCCIENINFSTDNNISDDPEFKEPGNDDYRISYNGGSPCIGAGDNTVNHESYDIRGSGYDRVVMSYNQSGQSALIDIGAYEYEHENQFDQHYKKAKSLVSYNLENISLFPNPANDNLFLNMNETVIHINSIQLYDISGKVIINKSFANDSFNNIRIDIRNIESGIYLLNIQNNYESIKKKVLIQ